jgi:beta-lactam-binding protein with PASTA domain
VAPARDALIVATDQYTDPGLLQLRSPAQDAEQLSRVLGTPEIGAFAVTTVFNQPSYAVNEIVQDFFADRSPDDLLLLHFSCHGVKSEDGELYFATANTRLQRLDATAVSAEFVNRLMNRSRSRSIVLILDCCYSGAFARGLIARGGDTVQLKERFDGRGRVVLTASNAMEYSFEGTEPSGTGRPSIFTSELVRGLETGEADRDRDGEISLDELYEYVYERVTDVTPNQTPRKWTFDVQGKLFIAHSPYTAPSAAAPLPVALVAAIESPYSSIRRGSITELASLLVSDDSGLAENARWALERLRHDHDPDVSSTATMALGVLDTPVSGSASVDADSPGHRSDRPIADEPKRLRTQDSGGGSPRRARSRIKTWRARPRFLLELTSVLLGAIVLIVAIAILAPRQAQAEVPSVAGNTRQAATEQLARSKLTYEVRARPDKAPKDTVLATDPPAGTRLTPGDVVIVYVSSGPKEVAVPKVKGKEKDDAKRLLQGAGFIVKEVPVTDAPEKDGIAIETDPPAGTHLAEGATVKLKISTSGKPLPDLAGQTVAAAEQALRALGLRPIVQERWSARVLTGRVIETSPPAGQRVPKGATVQVLASKGPAPTTTINRPRPTNLPPPTNPIPTPLTTIPTITTFPDTT